MTAAARTTFTTPSDREIVITRAFDAPRQAVFAAYTTAEYVPQWLGRRSFPMTSCEIDLRVGGNWRYVFTDSRGKTMGMSGTFREIDPPQRLVSTERFDDNPGETLNTLVLTEDNGRTTLRLTVLYESREVRDAVLGSGMKDGVAEGFERLAELLDRSADNPALLGALPDLGVGGADVVADLDADRGNR